jgi:hypothetical protein
MNRKHVLRLAAFALLAVVALGSAACVTTVGVGVVGPVYGGGYGSPYHGAYVGGPVWP